MQRTLRARHELCFRTSHAVPYASLIYALPQAMMDKTQDHYDQEYMGALLRGSFPRPGAKLRYKGTNDFHATNIGANAQRELRLGETYTLKMIRLASSWTCITLEETGDTEYGLAFFDDLSNANRNA